MKALQNFLEHISVRTFVYIFLLIILPFCAILFYTRASYEKYIRHELNERTVSQLKRSEDAIYTSFRKIINISSVLCNDKRLQEAFTDEQMSRYQRTLLFDELVHSIEINNLYDMDDIRVTIVDGTGEVYANWSTNYHDYRFIREQDWYRRALEHKGFVQWEMFAPSFIVEDQEKIRYISAARAMSGPFAAGEAPVAVVSIDQASLDRSLGQFLTSPSDAVFVCTSSGEILLSQDAEGSIPETTVRTAARNAKATDGSSVRTEGHVYLAACYTLSPQYRFNGEPIEVLYFARYDMVMKQMDALALRVLSVGLIAILILIWICCLISRKLTRPIVQLSQAMLDYRPERKIEGLDLKRRDEIGGLDRAFVRMADTIDHLFIRQREESKKREQYRYEALRAQINPHFLFNTLNMIRWMALIRKADNIVACLDALTTMLHYSMSKGGELVTLDEELKELDSYVFIYNCRYGNSYKLEKRLPEELRKLYVTKFILQPIVENAVLHGLKDVVSPGVIVLSGKIEDGKLKLFIEDNGVGLSEEDLEHLHDAKEKVTGIGIRNVDTRIRSSSGEGYGLRVYNKSADGEKTGGAIAEFTLPVIRKRDEDEENHDRR